MRCTVFPALFMTQSAPAPAVMPQGPASVVIRWVTAFVAGSIRTTSLLRKTVAQAAPASKATEHGPLAPTSIFARTSVARVAPCAHAASRADAMIATAAFSMPARYSGVGGKTTVPEFFSR